MIAKKVAVAAICIAASLGWSGLVARADQIVTLSQGSFSFYNGGEFGAVFSGSVVPSGLGNQQVFCVEIQEEFSPGTQYNYSLSNPAMIEYNGSQFTLAQPLPATMAAVEYLFYQFATHNLDQYNFGDNNSNDLTHLDDAGALQYALWDILGEDPQGNNGGFYTTLSGVAGGNPLTTGLALAAQWESEAAAAVAHGWQNTQSGGIVEIANLTTMSGGSAQDQLVLVTPAGSGDTSVPLPSTATACCGLLAGLGVFGVVRQKKSVLVA